MSNLDSIIQSCKEAAFDLDFKRAKAWKEGAPGRTLVGYLPIYMPREIVHAAGGLPVGIFGGGDRKPIVKGDAYYQSYICHIPRSVMEMVLDHQMDHFDGFVFPSICDVIRNLSGMFKQHGFGRFVKYLDLPQNFVPEIGGRFYVHEMEHILRYLREVNGKEVTTEDLNHSIRLYNRNRELIEQIYDLREEFPWRLSLEEWYYVLRAGTVIPVEEHNEMLHVVLEAIRQPIGTPQDRVKVVLSGAFCEQPAIGLIRAIEDAGCYVVEDDLMLGSRMILGPIDDQSDDPLEAIALAYLTRSRYSSSIYDVHQPKEDRLEALVRQRNASGVIFASASFCDPSLLDAPIFQNAFNVRGLRYIAFQYSENINQFKVIKEQVGAFADSIKLWEDEPAEVSIA
ncbi:MAG: benzoyl-CoA reductase subunit C [Saprospiraceae bacterium]|nr:benzoyl-CoA reductase subunit C [Saprospiraceae bacterium]